MTRMKRVVIIKDGKEIGYCRSVNSVGAYLYISETTVKNRLTDGKVIKGIKLRYFEEGDEKLPILEAVNAKRKGYKSHGEDREITDEDRQRYTIIKYEVTRARVSITPCPFFYSPKPMVGSMRCITCGSFRGRDKKNQEVMCGRKKYG